MRTYLDLRQDHRIADIGCGDGSFLANSPCAERIGIVPTQEERDRLGVEFRSVPGLMFSVGLADDVPVNFKVR